MRSWYSVTESVFFIVYVIMDIRSNWFGRWGKVHNFTFGCIKYRIPHATPIVKRVNQKKMTYFGCTLHHQQTRIVNEYLTASGRSLIHIKRGEDQEYFPEAHLRGQVGKTKYPHQLKLLEVSLINKLEPVMATPHVEHCQMLFWSLNTIIRF